MESKGVINIPNALSCFRIVAAPVLCYLIWTSNEFAFRWLITVSFFTDMIDGWIARRLHQTSKLGSILDSIGDSLTIIVGVIALIIFHPGLFNEYKLIVYVVIGLHLLQLSVSLWKYRKPSSFHTWSAKAAAFGIGSFILVTLHLGFQEWLFYVAIGLLIIDAIEETILVFMIPEWKNDVKGLWWKGK